MTPKLSVIIPVYNTEIYLRECLDSLINQTYKNIEIIIVNDCSPDNSEAIILEYQAKDPRIKYIKHQQNLSQGGARNTGISNATGKWISFIDSDDYIDLNTYEKMISLIDKNQADLGMFGVINFDDTTKKETCDPYFDSNIKVLTKISHQNFNKIRDGIVCNKIFKRSDIISHNIVFPEYLKQEDEEFWFKYVASVKPSVIGIDEKFYHYRQRFGSTMATSNSLLDMPQICLNIYTFLKQNNLLENYRIIFIKHITHHISHWTYFISAFTKEDCVKFIQDIKNILNLLQASTSELQQDLILEYIYTTASINNDSIVFLLQLQKYQNIQCDKWYDFGQLSKKQKIKKIVIVLSKKLKIYSVLKKLYKIVRR